MIRRIGRAALAGVLLAAGGPLVLAQEQDLESRVQELERENQELRHRVDVIAEEQERLEFGDVFPPVGDSVYGLGPAASKVYGVESGLSIGGYGEALFQFFSGRTDQFDFLRAVLYVGYRFSDKWVLNTELELEHATTGESGDVSVEFAYLDYLHRPAANVRVGMVLIPMGFVNELHEPTTFLGATRPLTEGRIIPTTWRENGAGLFGDAGPLSYRAYVVNGFDALGFADTGLRGGRQKGSKAKAEDLAAVARVDWTDTPGLLVGGAAYAGGAGQGDVALGTTRTTILEAHAEWKARGLWLRGLYANATVDDVAQLNARLSLTGNQSVGEEMHGAYVEAGYDLWSLLNSGGAASVSPYVRFEAIDTQAAVPAGFTRNPDNDFNVLSIGLNVQPISQLVFKLEFQDWEKDVDRVNFVMGYIF